MGSGDAGAEIRAADAGFGAAEPGDSATAESGDSVAAESGCNGAASGMVPGVWRAAMAVAKSGI